MRPDPLLTIDVAHPPLPADRVEELLLDALRRVRNSPALRVLKVVHGYGRGGRGSITRTVVRNWAYRNRSRLRAVIDGETYGPEDADAIALRLEAGIEGDPDFGQANAGITLLWVR